jgi:hypothetical protein
MSFHHLLPEGHRELGRLPTGAARAVFVASMVALFSPAGAEPRPFAGIAGGIGASVVLAWMGILLIERAGQDERRKGRGR